MIVRFITCQNSETLKDIVRYNNSQNPTAAPDFRSNDPIQRRLKSEFQELNTLEYSPRRGGSEDAIPRNTNTLPSLTAGQALAAFHGAPHVAYHQKNRLWEDDTLYSRYFNERTNANHIIFAYSCLSAIEKKKINLVAKSNKGELTSIEEDQLSFLRRRGSLVLLVSAIAKALESVLGIQVPDLFALSFQGNLPLLDAEDRWMPIVDIACSFTEPLSQALADGIRNENSVQNAVMMFRSYFHATRQANQPVFSQFSRYVA